MTRLYSARSPVKRVSPKSVLSPEEYEALTKFITKDVQEKLQELFSFANT